MSGRFRFPWDSEEAPPTPPADPDPEAPRPKPRGRRPGATILATGPGPARPPDWLYHHLTISGPAEGVEEFAAAARGAGVVPWRVDGADIEDTVFNLAVSARGRDRTLGVEGCRILARQFRDRVENHQARATALIGRSLACPFDLHALLPVPAAILQLEPTHPTALAWLAAHWGISDRLRQVSIRTKATTGRRLRNGHTVIGYGFFSAGGETPHVAIAQLAAQWPALRFALVPRPAD
jgi:hypothetical protein